jgi:hypothetical protein
VRIVGFSNPSDPLDHPSFFFFIQHGNRIH